MWSKLENLHFAFLAGICSAAASVFGKLSGLPDFEHYLIARMVFLALMITSNGCVWTLFVKALHQSDSSLLATVVSTASNFLCSALIGFFIFQERSTFVWWVGLSLIMFGLLCVIYGKENNTGLNGKSRGEKTTNRYEKQHQD